MIQPPQLPKSCSSHTLPQPSKWKHHTSKILGSSCLRSLIYFTQQISKSCQHCLHSDPSHHDPSSRLLQWPPVADTSVPRAMSACQISARLWWIAQFTLSVLPLQAHFGVLVFCSIISASSLQQTEIGEDIAFQGNLRPSELPTLKEAEWGGEKEGTRKQFC